MEFVGMVDTNGQVAPFTGAWIEIRGNLPGFANRTIVAPFTGAWIEMYVVPSITLALIMSHPSRVRGLKFVLSFFKFIRHAVAPFTGAWIEIASTLIPKN